MKKKYLCGFCLSVICALVFIIGTGCEQADTVYEGDYYLDSKDSLKALSGYTEITGSLFIGYEIGDPYADDFYIPIANRVRNLDGLESLTTIGGDLRIGYENIETGMALPIVHPLMTNIDGLCNLKDVGGSVYMMYNKSLKNVDGLRSLTTIGGKIDMYDNRSLENLDGFSGLTSVGGYIRLNCNDSMKSIKGFKNLTSLKGLYIQVAIQLTSLEGLENVTTIKNDLSLFGNELIKDMDALENLISVRDINITRSDALENISGLNNITHAGNIQIHNNDNLKSIELNGLTSCKSLQISGNDVLTDIAVNNLDSIQEEDSQAFNIHEGSLLIIGNAMLESVSGLTSLKHISDDIGIYKNPVLSDITFLEQVESVGGDLFFYCNSEDIVSQQDQLKDRLTAEGWAGCWDFTCDDTNNPVCPDAK